MITISTKKKHYDKPNKIDNNHAKNLPNGKENIHNANGALPQKNGHNHAQPSQPSQTPPGPPPPPTKLTKTPLQPQQTALSPQKTPKKPAQNGKYHPPPSQKNGHAHGPNNKKKHHRYHRSKKGHGKRRGAHKKLGHHKPPNIQKWISRRAKRDILFLLASISGIKMKIYSLPTNHHLRKPLSSSNLIRDRVCRVSMDGEYLSMGEDCLKLDKRLEISLGIDMCYANVQLMLKHLGLFDQCNRYHRGQFSSSSSSSSSTSTSSSATSSHRNTPVTASSSASSSHSSHHHHVNCNTHTATMTSLPAHFVKHNMRCNMKPQMDSNKLKHKHCITVHDPATARTLILQLSNCTDRQIWAKGLCGLKNMNHKGRSFRWTVVAYLISKYASTLNAHTQSNVSAKSNFKGVTQKGLNVLKLGFHSNKSKSQRHKQVVAYPSTMNNVPCYFEPFRQLIRVIGAGSGDLNRKYPRKFQKLYERRKHRLKYKQTNYEKFGENDLVYDPNKVKAKPEEAEIFYE